MGRTKNGQQLASWKAAENVKYCVGLLLFGIVALGGGVGGLAVRDDKNVAVLADVTANFLPGVAVRGEGVCQLSRLDVLSTTDWAQAR